MGKHSKSSVYISGPMYVQQEYKGEQFQKMLRSAMWSSYLVCP